MIETQKSEKINQKKAEKTEEKKTFVESAGLLIASGLVAGEALVGIILAILVVSQIKLNELVGNVNAAGEPNTGIAILGFVIILLLAFVLIYYPLKALKQAKN